MFVAFVSSNLKRFAPQNVLRDCSGSVGPNIRVGGNSADESVYTSGPLPPGDTYRITSADLEAYKLAIPTWNGSLTLGAVELGGNADTLGAQPSMPSRQMSTFATRRRLPLPSLTSKLPPPSCLGRSSKLSKSETRWTSSLKTASAKKRTTIPSTRANSISTKP